MKRAKFVSVRDIQGVNLISVGRVDFLAKWKIREFDSPTKNIYIKYRPDSNLRISYMGEKSTLPTEIKFTPCSYVIS